LAHLAAAARQICRADLPPRSRFYVGGVGSGVPKIIW